MTRELLLQYICPTTCTKDCSPLGRNNDDSCDYCDVKLNELLDKYDKHIIEQYKADTGLNDTIKDIHDNVANEMYCKGIDDLTEKLKQDVICITFGLRSCDIDRIAEELKEQDK